MKRYFHYAMIFILAILLTASTSAMATGEIYAAAASLQPAMDVIERAFKSETGILMQGVFASSGTLARQIEMGAPFSLFLSADESWATYLEEKGFLGELRPLVKCHLVLWSDSRETASIDLQKENEIRLAIADPYLAPFGSLAKSFMERQGIYRSFSDSGRLVVTGTVLQAVLAVRSGAADAALIPNSLAMRLKGSMMEVSAEPQVIFSGIVKTYSGQEATEFLRYLHGDSAKALFEENGFVRIQP